MKILPNKVNFGDGAERGREEKKIIIQDRGRPSVTVTNWEETEKAAGQLLEREELHLRMNTVFLPSRH